MNYDKATPAEVLALASERGFLLLGGGQDEIELYAPALVGVTSDPGDGWPRDGRVVAVYDADRIIEILTTRHGGGDDVYGGAREWHEFNTFCAWNGQDTPAFLWPDEEQD